MTAYGTMQQSKADLADQKLNGPTGRDLRLASTSM